MPVAKTKKAKTKPPQRKVATGAAVIHSIIKEACPIKVIISGPLSVSMVSLGKIGCALTTKAVRNSNTINFMPFIINLV